MENLIKEIKSIKRSSRFLEWKNTIIKMKNSLADINRTKEDDGGNQGN